MFRDCVEVLFGLVEVMLAAPVLLAFKCIDLAKPRQYGRRPVQREAQPGKCSV